jgi:hypothetical protein
MRQLMIALTLMRMALALLEKGGHITVSWRLREAIEDIENATCGTSMSNWERHRTQDTASNEDGHSHPFGRSRF